jgi:aerobic C4-dicarboxylate transport protein
MLARLWLKKLYVQVIIGMILGILLGHFDPHLAVQFKPLADLFIKAIKVVVTPVIFITIVVGIATIGDMRKVAKIGVKSLVYFEVCSTIALLIGTVVGNIWKVGNGINANPATLDAGSVANIVQHAKPMTIQSFMMSIVPNTFMEPFATGEILPVLFVALLFGIGLAKLGSRAKQLVGVLEQAGAGLFVMVGIIMRLAPLGAFGSLGFTIGKYGIGSLAGLGEVVCSVYIVSVLFIVTVLGTSIWLCGFNIFKLIAYFKEELIVVFAATSAETMIPRSMEKLERLGVEREVVGLVIPTGFSFNMAGTSIYMTIGVLFMAHAMNVKLSLAQQVSMFLIMLLTSKGAAGVAGGGFIALAATLPALGVLPVGGLSLLIGVDPFMAEVRAVTNLLSNIVATVVIGRWGGAINVERARAELNRGPGDDSSTQDKRKSTNKPLKLMSTLAVESALTRSLLPSWRAAGFEADVLWNPTSVLKERIRNGERADVVLMIDESIRELAEGGVVAGDSITPIAQADFGLAVAGGAQHPDISTPEAFVTALVEARSIVYSRTGASGIYFAELIKNLGIGDVVNERALIIDGGYTGKHLLTGECDLAVQQVSELMSVDGVEVVGHFPELYQKTTQFSVAIFTGAIDKELAARFVAHLSTREAAEAYGMSGLTSRLALQSVDSHGIHGSRPTNLHKASV